LQPAEVLVATSPHIEVARVKPVEIREQHYRLGEGRVRVLQGFDLSGPHGIGRIWEAPADIKLPVDTFEARYGQW